MKKLVYVFIVILLLVSCKTTQKTLNYGSPNVKQELYDEYSMLIRVYSEDKTYGYTQKNPIMVGGASENAGPLNERRFLNALTGPNGERISYERQGSCCHFNTKNSPFGGGLLDVYEVSWDGIKEPVLLYINMYDSDMLQVPVGFKLRY